MTDTTASTSASQSDRQIGFEDFVNARLTLVAMRNQLDTQVASLRSQLAIAESQLRQTEDLLRRADKKLASQDPVGYAALTAPTEPPSASRRSKR